MDSAGFHRIPSGTLSGILTMVVLWIPLPCGILSEILTDSSHAFITFINIAISVSHVILNIC